MIFRRATELDIDAIMIIIQQAQEAFREAGISQWQNQYPNPERIQEDIANSYGYVVEEKHKIIATVAFSFDGDSNYLIPVEGLWQTKEPYAVIHRIAIHEHYQGKETSRFLMENLYTLAEEKEMQGIRVDTHTDNMKMKSYLKKNGFTFMGIIRLQDGALRDAFEKRIV